MPSQGPNVDSDLSLNEEQFQANRYDLLSRLADDLAHEIKNPLNAIIINLEVLRVRVVKGQVPEALERAAVIEHETRRLHGLVDRLLQLLRPYREESGGLALDQVLDELLPLVEAQARLARNEFVVDAEAAVFITMRRDLFKFAMLNLFIAVHERLGEGGGALKVTCRPGEGEVRLRIEAVHEGNVAPGPSLPGARTVQLAAALLAASGGRVEPEDSAVSVVLPRSGGV